MSRDMKQKFGFINVSSNAFSDITDDCVNVDYSAPSPIAVMYYPCLAFGLLVPPHPTVLLNRITHMVADMSPAF
jgi:hypothetical protein